MSKISTAKQIAKIAGKVALVAICPPLGFATLGKDSQERFGGALLGMVGSAIMSVGSITLLETLLLNHLYDTPQVHVRYVTNNSLRGLAEAFISPLVFVLDSHKETFIGPSGKNGVYGQDVITFDKDTKQYFLDFGEGRRFRTINGDLVSVAEARAGLDALVANQAELVSKGDIIRARKISEKVDAARAAYEELRGEYTDVHSLYTQTVYKMNAALEELSHPRTSVQEQMK